MRWISYFRLNPWLNRYGFIDATRPRASRPARRPNQGASVSASPRRFSFFSAVRTRTGRLPVRARPRASRLWPALPRSHYSKRWSVRNRVPRVARLDSLYCIRNWPSARLYSLYPQGIANFRFAAWWRRAHPKPGLDVHLCSRTVFVRNRSCSFAKILSLGGRDGLGRGGGGLRVWTGGSAPLQASGRWAGRQGCGEVA